MNVAMLPFVLLLLGIFLWLAFLLFRPNPPKVSRYKVVIMCAVLAMCVLLGIFEAIYLYTPPLPVPAPEPEPAAPRVPVALPAQKAGAPLPRAERIQRDI